MASKKPPLLSPAEARVVQALKNAPNNQLPIHELFRCLRSSVLVATRRDQQMQVGSCVSRINLKLKKNKIDNVVRLGTEKGTYRLWASQAAYVASKR